MRITLHVTKEEYCGIRAIATRCGVSVTEILEQLVADLTHSPRTGGSDERNMADAYVRRCNYAGGLWGVDSHTPKELRDRYELQANRAMKWYDAALWFRHHPEPANHTDGAD